MEQKRELSSVDLRALVGELSGCTGAVLDKAYRYGEDLLRCKLRHHDRGRLELLVEVGEVKRLHLADPEHVADAPARPPNFAMMLRNRLEGARLVSVEQYEFDRIVVLTFERADGRTRLVVELFGDGNVAVLDATETVIDCLRTVRLKSRTVAPGSTYGFPTSRVDPFELDGAAFAARMADSDTDLVRTLATQLNFGGFYAEELCTRAGVDKTLPIEDAPDAAFAALHEAICDLADSLTVDRLDPRVYAQDGRRVDVSPVPLEERTGLEATAFSSFNAALDDYFAHLDRDGDGDDSPDLAALIDEHERIIDQQEAAIEQFARDAEREREKAELVYAHYGLVDELLTTVRQAREDGHGWEDIDERLGTAAERGVPGADAIVDVDPAAGTVTVELEGHRVDLDPSVGVERNADRLYTGAKRIEEKREGALDAVAETREELEQLEHRRAGTDDDGDREDDDGPIDWLGRPSIPVRKPDHWFERFRWFRTSDGYLVIGGRDADQNEELVGKYLERGDRFLHAQAAGAPATVLKATEPGESPKAVDLPERSLEEAAQFAVSYSSVWRDGHFAGDVYAVGPEQVTKTPESGEYLQKGSFAIRGERTYYRDVAVGCAVGIACEPETRVIGGPPDPIDDQAATAVRVEPGRYARSDTAKRIYRTFRERFEDTGFVRQVAGPEAIADFLPPGGSRIVD